LKPESVSTKQERIAQLAKNNPAMAFTSLNHYLDRMDEYAYERTRKTGGRVDGQTAQEYALNWSRTCAACWIGSNRVIIEHHPYGVITLISGWWSAWLGIPSSKTKSRNGRL